MTASLSCDWFSGFSVSLWSAIVIKRPFPSSLVPLIQSESKCETILMKMILICMKMKLHTEFIFIRMVSHLDSFWNRGTRELGNGLLNVLLLRQSTENHSIQIVCWLYRDKPTVATELPMRGQSHKENSTSLSWSRLLHKLDRVRKTQSKHLSKQNEPIRMWSRTYCSR